MSEETIRAIPFTSAMPEEQAVEAARNALEFVQKCKKPVILIVAVDGEVRGDGMVEACTYAVGSSEALLSAFAWLQEQFIQSMSDKVQVVYADAEGAPVQ